MADSVIPLFLISWTLHFDTIYACQDRKDDIKVCSAPQVLRISESHYQTALGREGWYKIYSGVTREQSPLVHLRVCLAPRRPPGVRRCCEQQRISVLHYLCRRLSTASDMAVHNS